jgi:hypothetical protein
MAQLAFHLSLFYVLQVKCGVCTIELLRPLSHRLFQKVILLFKPVLQVANTQEIACAKHNFEGVAKVARDEVRCSELIGSAPTFEVVLPRIDKYGNEGVRRVLSLDLLKHFKPALTGHRKVENHKIGIDISTSRRRIS